MQDKTDSATTGMYRAYKMPVKDIYNFQTMLYSESLQEMSLEELHECFSYNW